MAVEIERKFLVSAPSWKTGNGSLLRQGYLSRTPERTVRVRLADDAAWLTIKGVTTGTSRAEFEYRIPCDDAAELLKLCDGPLLEKTRYRVEHCGHIWEVDEFHGDNEGLVVAEVELQHENESIEMPPWIGDEVTNDVRYFNSNLARQPFRLWPRN